MQLFVKQKVFSWNSKFSVKDANGEDRYFVEGELFSWGHKLHVYAQSGDEVAFIKQKLLSWLPKYEVYVGGCMVVEVVKEMSFFKQRYTLRTPLGPGWTVDGDLWAHTYTIRSGAQPIASVEKAWLNWGDSYAINLDGGADEVMVIATVLAIDCAMASQNNAT